MRILLEKLILNIFWGFLDQFLGDVFGDLLGSVQRYIFLIIHMNEISFDFLPGNT